MSSNSITSGKANIKRHNFLHVSNNIKMVTEGTIETIYCKDILSQISVTVSTTELYRGHFQYCNFPELQFVDLRRKFELDC